ncbi:MAG: ATP-binding protein [Bacillota bacterium]
MVKPAFKKQFLIGGSTESISEVIENILLLLKEKNLQIEDMDFRIELVLREMIANAVEHGCDKNNDFSQIKIKLEIKKNQISISVKDQGDGFEWQKRDLETLPIFAENGRGLIIINKTADRIEFNDCGNKIKVHFDFSEVD